MERFVKGDVVVIPFPFSDLSDTKRRPALVLADLQGSDIILCQITSQNTRDILAVSLNFEDFARGSLPANSSDPTVFLLPTKTTLFVKRVLFLMIN